MRILVFSYEFLPSDAPQALRVSRLMRELVACGHEVDVIAAMGPTSALPYELLDGVAVHRVNPGGVDGLVVRLKQGRAEQPVTERLSSPVRVQKGLNWKGRCIHSIRRMTDLMLFPDSRSLWISGALRCAQALVARVGVPDLIIGSHEPAAGVIAAMQFAQETGTELVSELGDPILATYTARRWRSRALRLEREVCEQSAAVVLTSAATAELFDERHGAAAKLHVISQGFDPQPDVPHEERIESSVLRLVYTGRFYPFRDPMPLLQAVAQVQDCELVIAAPELPRHVEEFMNGGASNCSWLGSLPHADALRLQRVADLLVSIGNAGMTQVPGKVLEYMGSGRPILHIRSDAGDAAAALISIEHCGYVVDGYVSDIASLLGDLTSMKKQGALEDGLVLGADSFEKYSWRRLGQRLSAVCTSVQRNASTRAGH
ncbi:glycosyltransferase [Stenotrophomonas maltophilia]|uniref:glycosyltransferase n=1 Tax=Stenotrophomonas maltophilia TaxID=40324 RepID=UPI0009ACA9D0|nr:glycosyltransferase [Stenotrophomonas maltophilia]MBA0461037.1 glycosyltransferase [Stenotrophomonas maltophilia]MBH1609663.1 glycosyltransferase [Stenotrophomonas maltophilia]MBH1724705.1 glycosyltransferase [Stenotrophomonas maltophilia]MBH1797545.1 glycosyltransferase [Stenotrophomonas maltophilia]MBH1806999.1 glycosyltransferase [Stenotrophomonas maltophilia]